VNGETAVPVHGSAGKGEMKTILMVDDSAAMLQLVVFTMKSAGFEVMTAARADEAVEKAARSKFDMVITDLNMPERDGIDLIRSLRANPDYKFVPIIMLTTESQEARKQEGRKAGASGWVVKPFSPDRLLDVVRRFMK
jgi:two-component system, chemotaxis family, chemotaxis protein CheY